VTSLVIEQFGTPASTREARVLEFARRRAANELAGRTVWCACSLRAGRFRARALRSCIRAAGGGGVDSGWIDVQAREPLSRLAERLDEMLRGEESDSSLGPEEDQIYSEGVQESDRFVAREVRPGDVVVVHDPLGVALASAFRAHGAHVVWRTSVGPRQETVIDAWRFVHRRGAGLDAYVTGWRPSVARRFRRGVAAFMSSPDVVSAKEVAPPGGEQTYDEITWTSLLADVVQADREERVGGTLHARPGVAAR
jgi:hypothetical protein